MFERLFNYFESKSGITLDEEACKLIESHFINKRLRRKQYFLQEGDVCKHMGFIIKGAARMYSIDEKGNEHILRFGMESWWIGDYESYMLQTPSAFHIEMLEDTDLLMITRNNIQELIEAVPAVAETIKALDKQSAITTQRRLHAAISLTAEERYELLQKTYPDFMQRFPQNMIASYLGISAETLSRIKKSTTHRQQGKQR
jgi:CRP-like cAMP-binding protein